MAAPVKQTETTEPGQAAPEFTLTDQDGQSHTLADYKGRWVVLYFYPKDSTPGCTKQACQFRDSIADYAKRHAVVLGVSPDSGQSHQKFIKKHGLPFTLLVDSDTQASQAYGVWRQKSMFGKKYMGIVRTTYLIDPAGLVAHRWDKVKVTDHAAAVLSMIDRISKAR